MHMYVYANRPLRTTGKSLFSKFRSTNFNSSTSRFWTTNGVILIAKNQDYQCKWNKMCAKLPKPISGSWMKCMPTPRFTVKNCYEKYFGFLYFKCMTSVPSPLVRRFQPP